MQSLSNPACQLRAAITCQKDLSMAPKMNRSFGGAPWIVEDCVMRERRLGVEHQ